jgi:predicted transcriptional regulator
MDEQAILSSIWLSKENRVYLENKRCASYNKKSSTMSTAELKLQIFRQIDSLDRKNLEKLHHIVDRLIDRPSNPNDWDELTEQQQQGILDAVEEAEAGYLVSHEEVMKKARTKINNAILH